ncbi:MAG: YeeE/YedE family protein [Amylibacter sp.]|nr:YeeE/YedE family protein [Amylibacter sp.]
MDYITWAYGLLGGLMIGSAAAIFLLFNGKIMGASGIVGGLIDGSGRNTWGERLLFIAGLVGAPALLGLFTKLPETNVTDNIGLLIVAGLLVGVGTRLGSGCTSGHGVCGISRLSLRSIIATLVYIGAGAAIIVIARSLGVL